VESKPLEVSGEEAKPHKAGDSQTAGLKRHGLWSTHTHTHTHTHNASHINTLLSTVPTAWSRPTHVHNEVDEHEDDQQRHRHTISQRFHSVRCPFKYSGMDDWAFSLT